MQRHLRLLIFTDLDGTLLDYNTYSYDAALPALNKLRECGIPLVIVTSKTRAEIEPMKELLSLSKTFIVENGSAIFLHRDFAPPPGIHAELKSGYRVIVLGKHYREALDALHRARSNWSLCKSNIKGFSDMTVDEVAAYTGLSPESAALAKEREFSEPFVFKGSQADLMYLKQGLGEMGMTCLEGGRLYHAQGLADKAEAAKMTGDIYRYAYPEISWKTVALGDGPNDVGLLRSADIAVIIKKPDNTCLEYDSPPGQRVIIPNAAGPAGWNEAVVHLIQEEACHG